MGAFGNRLVTETYTEQSSLSVSVFTFLSRRSKTVRSPSNLFSLVRFGSEWTDHGVLNNSI